MLTDRHRRAVGWTALLLCAVVFIAAQPIAVPLVLGTWLGTLSRPVADRLERALGKRSRGAALFTLVLVLALVGIFALLYTALGKGLMGLLDELTRAEGVEGAFKALVTERREPADVRRIQEFAKQHGQEVQSATKVVGILGLGTLFFLFFLALSCFGTITAGDRFHSWLRARSPLSPQQFDRLAVAWTETGRGLFVSIGLTCASQGVLCTVTFLLLGVPRALVLGFVCSMFAILPLVGTPLVWIPVAIGLYLTGSLAKAIILVFVGALVIGAIEFFVGPAFAKLGRFKLPSELILVAMFGAALGLGPGGLILGPLAFRLAQEALDLAREARAVGEEPA